MIVPSVFVDSRAEQWKRHMSINLNNGLWQCFKSGNNGNFIRLYAKLEKIAYAAAYRNLLFQELLNEKSKGGWEQALPTRQEHKANEYLAETGAIPIAVNTSCRENSKLASAWSYVYERKLFDVTKSPGDTQFYLGTRGKWANRLLIPFFDEEGEVFFFQGRSLDKSHPKYLNCEGVKASNVLYPFDSSKPYVVVCEGPVDAISLQRQNVNATCTMTSKPSEIQINQLAEAEIKIVVGYDNDKAGWEGLQKFEELRKKYLLEKIYVVLPPEEFKDWGNMHEKSMDVKSYIEDNMTEVNFSYAVNILLNKL